MNKKKLQRVARKYIPGEGKRQARNRADDMGYSAHLDKQYSKHAPDGPKEAERSARDARVASKAQRKYKKIANENATMTFKDFLQEGVDINQLLTPEEQRAAIEAIKNNQSTRDFEDIASQRLREKGMNVPLNIAIFLKWKHALDQKFNPQKFELPGEDDVAASWDSYGKARQRGDVQGIGPGGNRNWTGD